MKIFYWFGKQKIQIKYAKIFWGSVATFCSRRLKNVSRKFLQSNVLTYKISGTLAGHIGTVITLSFLMQNFHMKVFGHNWFSGLFEWIIQEKLVWRIANSSLLVNAILCVFPHLVIKWTALDLKVSCWEWNSELKRDRTGKFLLDGPDYGPGWFYFLKVFYNFSEIIRFLNAINAI